jgi:transcription antitermination factor NusG
MVPKEKIWARRKRLIYKPIFPSYVFVGVEDWARVGSRVLGAPGVVYVLRHNGVPCPIKPEEAESLRIMIRAQVDIAPSPYFKEGDPVRLVKGPLAGALGYMVQPLPDKRTYLVVSIDILGRSVQSRIYEDWIEKL